MPLQHWLQLSLTEGIGPILARRVIDAAGGIEAACEAPASLLALVAGIGRSKASSIATSLKTARIAAEQELAKAHALTIQILCPEDEAFPILLLTIPDPPLVLYMMGSLEPRDLNAVAIVGSRKCSNYGREQSERFAASLAGVGVTVVSGGARGIDSAAHRGAIAHSRGRTVAVLGSGLDVPYPPENEPLFRQIADGHGAVLSEFPFGTAPNRENFPRRNRVVSGMSRCVLVIEADVRSGALITARQAGTEHGRPVLALPGRIDNPLSAGPHALIRDGATLVTNLGEVLDALGPLPQNAIESDLFANVPAPAAPDAEIASSVEVQQPHVFDGMSDQQRTLLAAMGDDECHIDMLIERTSLSAQAVLQELTLLSLKGQVRRIEGQTFAKRKKS